MGFNDVVTFDQVPAGHIANHHPRPLLALGSAAIEDISIASYRTSTSALKRARLTGLQRNSMLYPTGTRLSGDRCDIVRIDDRRRWLKDVL